jgi:hypothetical protein
MPYVLHISQDALLWLTEQGVNNHKLLALVSLQLQIVLLPPPMENVIGIQQEQPHALKL